MASKTTLNAKNLEALGAERLAELLIDISTGSAAAKRKLRLALAAAQSPREAAREITKRLTSIARARGFINWKNRKKLVDDLETQRRAIFERIVPPEPHDEGISMAPEHVRLEQVNADAPLLKVHHLNAVFESAMLRNKNHHHIGRCGMQELNIACEPI